jgi:hypothetical protein
MGELTLLKRIVSSYYGISEEELMMDTRVRDIVKPRMVFCYIGKKLKYSATQLALSLKKKQGLIFHGAKVIEKELTYDQGLALEIKSLFRIINQTELGEEDLSIQAQLQYIIRLKSFITNQIHYKTELKTQIPARNTQRIAFLSAEVNALRSVVKILKSDYDTFMLKQEKPWIT